eukprot:3428229-Pleurochrysis_carterae.AAC.3
MSATARASLGKQSFCPLSLCSSGCMQHARGEEGRDRLKQGGEEEADRKEKTGKDRKRQEKTGERKEERGRGGRRKNKSKSEHAQALEQEGESLGVRVCSREEGSESGRERGRGNKGGKKGGEERESESEGKAQSERARKEGFLRERGRGR